MKYFMHRIQKAGDNFTTGIETHDTLDSAILSFWGRMKTGYGKSENTFVSCKITDEFGGTIEPYNMTWLQEGSEQINKFFLHHIRKDGETYNKAIDTLDSLETAYGNLAALMEYGYNNTKFPNVTFVHCDVTDLLSGGMVLIDRKWVKEVPMPESEPEPEEEEFE